jgi:hypothetical protein
MYPILHIYIPTLLEMDKEFQLCTVRKTSAFHQEFHQPDRKAQDQTINLGEIYFFPSTLMLGLAPIGGFFFNSVYVYIYSTASAC